MSPRLIVAGALMVAALVVAFVLDRRRPDAPAGNRYAVPRQLDRADFPRPEADWLVALFSSIDCDSCQTMVPKVRVLESTAVATVDVPYQTRRDLHRRYTIDGVPLVVVADREGVVRAGFVGAVSSTDLWAAVAELREPGSTPEPMLGRFDD